MRVKVVPLLLLTTLAITLFQIVFINGGKTYNFYLKIGATEIWIPVTVDPAFVFGGPDIQLILSIYETLVGFKGSRTDSFIPKLAIEWHISEDGMHYFFKIRNGVKFHNGETLTPEDVEYSFERLLVMDSLDSEGWMLHEALLGNPEGVEALGNLSDPQDAASIANLIDHAVESNETHVWFNLAKPYSPFLSVLCQPYCSILNKEFCIEHECWPGTWENWTAYHDPRIPPLDSPKPAMCGTGPYQLDYLKKGEWSIVKFDDYWGGWPAYREDLGKIQEGYIAKVTMRYNYTHKILLEKFLTGEIEIAYIPERQEYMEQLQNAKGIRCIHPLPKLELYILFFNLNITKNPYPSIYGVILPPGELNETGIPSNFFSDPYVRKGFAYAINYTEYLERLKTMHYLYEAQQPVTPIVEGMPYANPNQQKYYFDLEKAKECFQKAWNGKLWSKGFTITLGAPFGYYYWETVVNILKDNIESLNPKFHVKLKDMPPPTILPSLFYKALPLFVLHFAPFIDPHEVMMQLMHSNGCVTKIQNYKNSSVDQLMDEELRTTNVTRRKEIFRKLQGIYYNQCIGIPLAQPLTRHWERKRIQGYYYNPAIPQLYFYHLWKKCPGDLNDDYKINILDIAMVAKAFGSKPGDPTWIKEADINQDNIIDIVDITLIAQKYGEQY